MQRRNSLRLKGIDEHAEVAEVGVEMAKPVEDDEEHAEYSSGLSSEEEKVEEEEEEKALTASERLKSSVHSSIRTFGEATINRDIEAQVSVECFVKFDTWYHNMLMFILLPSCCSSTQAFEASAKEIWETGEEFDLHAEEMFSYLQVLTACLLSFAHGVSFCRWCLYHALVCMMCPLSG